MLGVFSNKIVCFQGLDWNLEARSPPPNTDQLPKPKAPTLPSTEQEQREERAVAGQHSIAQRRATCTVQHVRRCCLISFF